MDIKIQAKLLRAIQEKEIDRIGGKSPIKVNTRIIATSNRNLDEAVKKGIFRQDLYYRLNVVNINIPPLRDRMEDVIVLSKHFAKKYSELNDIPLKPISNEAEKKLLNYRWPGIVRELENTIHRAVLLSTGEEISADAIILDDLSAIINNEQQQDVLTGGEFTGNTLASMERNLIIDTLKHTMGNRTMAANILGISIRTLRNKLKQYQDEGMDI
jgi:DNA-binding NtrC family response regulator